jgi:hypothetical protein
VVVLETSCSLSLTLSECYGSGMVSHDSTFQKDYTLQAKEVRRSPTFL